MWEIWLSQGLVFLVVVVAVVVVNLFSHKTVFKALLILKLGRVGGEVGVGEDEGHQEDGAQEKVEAQNARNGVPFLETNFLKQIRNRKHINNSNPYPTKIGFQATGDHRTTSTSSSLKIPKLRVLRCHSC